MIECFCIHRVASYSLALATYNTYRMMRRGLGIGRYNYLPQHFRWEHDGARTTAVKNLVESPHSGIQRSVFPALSILLLTLSIPATVVCQATSHAAVELPPMSKLWTDDEKAEFQTCFSKGKNPFCEVWEEQQRWMRAHPEASKRKSNHARFHACSQKHAAQINGAPEQARAALDLCWCRAYGLPEPR